MPVYFDNVACFKTCSLNRLRSRIMGWLCCKGC